MLFVLLCSALLCSALLCTNPHSHSISPSTATAAATAAAAPTASEKNDKSPGTFRVRLKLWDIAGQDRFAKLTRSYFQGAMGAIVVSDVTRPGTFEAAASWKKELDACESGRWRYSRGWGDGGCIGRKKTPATQLTFPLPTAGCPGVPVVFLANKSDLFKTTQE